MGIQDPKMEVFMIYDDLWPLIYDNCCISSRLRNIKDGQSIYFLDASFIKLEQLGKCDLWVGLDNSPARKFRGLLKK